MPNAFVQLFCNLTLSLVLQAGLSPAGAEETRPDIIFILADDLGYGDIGCYGRDDLSTPNLDALAAAGVRFTSHYANGPECTPTRAAFLTGRYQQWIGGLECAIGTGNLGRYDDAIRLREQEDLGLPASTPTIAKALKQAGYRTALTGKWHLGYEPKFAPNLQGFDSTLYCIGGGMSYFHYLDNLAGHNLFQDGQPIRAAGHATDLFADAAIETLKQQSETPLFLYLPFTCPHSPFQGPDEDFPQPLHIDSPRWNQGKAPPDVYRSMIEHMDDCIGRVLAAAKQRDSRSGRNTLIIFASDNGGTASARNTPLSGSKGSTLEGGIRVPGIAVWPGHIAAGTESNQPCITFDFTASIARISGASFPEEHPLDGIDILKHVEKAAQDVDRLLFWRKPRGDMIWKGVRDGHMKYVARVKGDTEEQWLYDLANDISETNNLIATHPAIAAAMRAKYDAWETTTRHDRRGSPTQ